MDKLYLELLATKLKRFEGEKITELTDDEIQEYVNLKREIGLELQPLAEAIAKVIRPMVVAEKKYNQRVLGKE